MAIIAYPLNDIDYTAEDAQSYFAPRTAGIFSLGKDYVVSSAGGMDLTVSTGRGWMKPSEFTGFSVVSTEPTALTVGESHPTMDRYDRVVLRYDKGANKVEILLVQGTSATEAVPPDIQRTDSIYELGLAVIHVPAGALELTTDNIEDTRSDVGVCGIVNNEWTGGQSTLEIKFASGYVGKNYSLVGPNEEYHGGTVPESLTVEMTIGSQNAIYTLTVQDFPDPTEIEIGPYYGEYKAEFTGYPELEKCSWDIISNASEQNLAASVWAVGDAKTIVVNGPVNGSIISNVSIAAFIVGFNHNEAEEGSNRIHFLIGKISGTDIAFCDTSYETTYGHFTIDGANWKDCPARNTFLGNSGNPSSPASESFMNALPKDLLAVMKTVTKWTDNVGHESASQSAVTPTTDYLSFPSEYEVCGVISFANTYERYHQEQYEYFKSGNSWAAFNHRSQSANAKWWSRSQDRAIDYDFIYFTSGGGRGRGDADTSLGYRVLFYV